MFSLRNAEAQSVIQNGGFESWAGGIPAFWTLVSGTIHQIPGFVGTACRLGGGPPAEPGWNQGVVISQTVAVAAGASCSLNFYAKADNPWGALSARAELHWKTSGLVVITTQSVPVGVSATWVQCGGVYTAPAGAAFVEVRFVKMSWGYLDVDEATLIAPQLPDLTIVSIGLSPPVPAHGDSVTFYATVVNQGAATANNIRVDCYLDGGLHATGSIWSLTGNGGSTQVRASWIAVQGLHTLRWIVDPFSAITESNENNNDMSMPFSVGPPPFDFAVSATPTSQSVSQGQTASYAVTVTLVTGTATTVTLSLSGNPTGTTPVFVQQSGLPTFSTRLDVTTASGTAPGTYPLTITGTGGAGLIRTFQVTLIVLEKPDFTISVSPTSQTVLQGKTTTYTVSITPLGGFSGSVALSLSGLPVDAVHTFSPLSATTTSTLTVTAGDTTGTFLLAITGTTTISGAATIHTTTVTLIVSLDPERQASKDAIEAAQDAINRAEREGRAIGLDDAKVMLGGAKTAFAKGNYAEAKSLAEQAKDLGEKARSFIQAYGLYIAVGATLTAAAVIALATRKRWQRLLRKRRIKAKKQNDQSASYPTMHVPLQYSAESHAAVRWDAYPRCSTL